jgi:hypothetical protein
MTGKRELLSDAEIDFLLDAAAKATAEAPTSELEGGQDREVTMRGDLGQIDLADIFQTLAMTKMEGVLRLRNPLGERHLHCRDGYVRVHMPNRVATRRLGHQLLHSGRIRPEDLRAALEAQRQQKQPLGQVLVGLGSITQQALDEVLAEQVAHDLFSIFTWRYGTFEFWKGPPTAALDRLLAGSAEYEIHALLLEVARRSDDWTSIHDSIGSLDEVPARLDGASAPPGELPAQVLARVDGATSYREIAEQLPDDLFDVACAARDLARSRAIANLDDDSLLALARSRAEAGDTRRSLLALLCLRARPGARALATLQGMATTLEQIGERREAASLLLAAAQQQLDPTAALPLVRQAHRLAPRDLATLQALRGLLLETKAPAAEIAELTLDVLDAMIEGGQAAAALEMLTAQGAGEPPAASLLQREVRARQRLRDLPGALRALEQLAKTLDARGDVQQANEAWSALLRLDRSRKDVRKLLAQRRRTRFDRLLRAAAAAMVALTLGSMGIVWWREAAWTAAFDAADREISALLARHDLAAARERLAALTAAIGACDATASIEQTIRHAEAEAARKRQAALRQRLNAVLATASRHMDQGELQAALAAYGELANEPGASGEIVTAATARLDAAVQMLTLVAKSLDARLPPLPQATSGREGLLQNLRLIDATCPPLALRIVAELEALLGTGMPAFLPPELRERCRQLCAEHAVRFHRARELRDAYAEALRRVEQQQKLDPLWKAAQEHERNYDFAQALAAYRDLEQQPSNTEDLRAHFRDRVARNAMIVRLLESLHAATSKGDFATAQQHLRALRRAHPDVPFERLVRLPLHIQSAPAGALVRCNGQEVGHTPMVLARRPADAIELELLLDGFRRISRTISGDDTQEWAPWLELEPQRTWSLGKALASRPTAAGSMHLFVDRSGAVEAWTLDATRRWRAPTGDLSGLLMRPLVHGRHVLVASLDGDLRAYELESGALAWSRPDLPCEVEPLLLRSWLFLADCKARLHRIDLDDRSVRQCQLPVPAQGPLLAHGSTVLVLGERGRVLAYDAVTLDQRWSRQHPGEGALHGVLAEGRLVIVDEHGLVQAIDGTRGELVWQRDLGDEPTGQPWPADDGIWIFARGQVVRLSLASGAVQHRRTAGGEQWRSGSALVGDRLVLALQHGAFEVCDARDGTSRYRIPGSRQARAFPLDRGLVVSDADGTIQWFERLR